MSGGLIALKFIIDIADFVKLNSKNVIKVRKHLRKIGIDVLQ